MIQRREFGKTLVSGAIGAGVNRATASPQAARLPRKNTLMHVGADYHVVAGGPRADITGKANLEYNLRHGVKHLTAQVQGKPPDGAWNLEELKRMKDNCDKAGFIFEAIRMDSEYIMLRQGLSWKISRRLPRWA
jgi:flavin-dependent dehydrogenase